MEGWRACLRMGMWLLVFYARFGLQVWIFVEGYCRFGGLMIVGLEEWKVQIYMPLITLYECDLLILYLH